MKISKIKYQKSKILIAVLIMTVGGALVNHSSAFVLAANSQIEKITSGLVIKTDQQSSASFHFMAGDRPITELGYKAGEIKSVIKNGNPLSSTLEFYSTDRQKNPGIKLLPDGSFTIGGLSNDYTNPGNPTSEVPVELPQGFENLTEAQKRNGVYDFFLSIPKPNENPVNARPRLYVRNLTATGINDPGVFVLGSARSNRQGSGIRYGRPDGLETGATIGTLRYDAFTDRGFNPVAGIYAKVAAQGLHPSGHMYLATTDTRGRYDARMTLHYSGNVGIGDGEMEPRYALEVQGDIAASGTKEFIIDHPVKPNMSLVHAAIEGPESAVYYRGESALVNGQAAIELPEYFEKLTRKEGRTIRLTNIDGFEKLAVKLQEDVQVKDGNFIVISVNPDSTQKFYWEVKAVRNDIPPLEVEKVD